MDIILYLLHFIQYQHQQIYWLLNFICRYIPLKQWTFDDFLSPRYQNFKIDELPLITDFTQDWTYKDLILYYEKCYGKEIKSINRRSECDILEDCCCPHCGNTLVAKKNRKHFIIHKYVNSKCPYYLHNLKKVDKEHLNKPYVKNEYKLH